MPDKDQIKTAVAQKALSLILPGMSVGLGSGSTAQIFIQLLGEQKPNIEVIAASIQSEQLALKAGLSLNPGLTSCDLYIDGTDEFDDDKNCLKGKGQALFREKIIATMSKEVVILADYTKKSTQLIKSPLVCEILPFGHEATIKHINQEGFKGSLRLSPHKQPILTDNNNYLFDIELTTPITEPSKVHHCLKHIPGVLETGLFFNIVNKIIVGLKEGQVILFE
jgi:ribose 5-phosphate isomerase A